MTSFEKMILYIYQMKGIFIIDQILDSNNMIFNKKTINLCKKIINSFTKSKTRSSSTARTTFKSNIKSYQYRGNSDFPQDKERLKINQDLQKNILSQVKSDESLKDPKGKQDPDIIKSWKEIILKFLKEYWVGISIITITFISYETIGQEAFTNNPYKSLILIMDHLKNEQKGVVKISEGNTIKEKMLDDIEKEAQKQKVMNQKFQFEEYSFKKTLEDILDLKDHKLSIFIDSRSGASIGTNFKRMIIKKEAQKRQKHQKKEAQKPDRQKKIEYKKDTQFYYLDLKNFTKNDTSNKDKEYGQLRQVHLLINSLLAQKQDKNIKKRILIINSFQYILPMLQAEQKKKFVEEVYKQLNYIQKNMKMKVIFICQNNQLIYEKFISQFSANIQDFKHVKIGPMTTDDVQSIIKTRTQIDMVANAKMMNFAKQYQKLMKSTISQSKNIDQSNKQTQNEINKWMCKTFQFINKRFEQFMKFSVQKPYHEKEQLFQFNILPQRRNQIHEKVQKAIEYICAKSDNIKQIMRVLKDVKIDYKDQYKPAFKMTTLKEDARQIQDYYHKIFQDPMHHLDMKLTHDLAIKNEAFIKKKQFFEYLVKIYNEFVILKNKPLLSETQEDQKEKRKKIKKQQDCILNQLYSLPSIKKRHYQPSVLFYILSQIKKGDKQLKQPDNKTDPYKIYSLDKMLEIYKENYELVYIYEDCAKFFEKSLSKISQQQFMGKIQKKYNQMIENKKTYIRSQLNLFRNISANLLQNAKMHIDINHEKQLWFQKRCILNKIFSQHINQTKKYTTIWEIIKEIILEERKKKQKWYSLRISEEQYTPEQQISKIFFYQAYMSIVKSNILAGLQFSDREYIAAYDQIRKEKDKRLA